MAINDAKVRLKVLVEKERNRVVFAEADKDFVDILCSFLLLPLGTIARLLSNNLERELLKVGSLNSLYEGVANLDKDHFCNDACKAMLLSPRSSAEALFQNLIINIDDTEPTKYYMAHEGICSGYYFLSTYKNTRCSCGTIMSIEIDDRYLKTVPSYCKDGVFVPKAASFIVTDDLHVMPNSVVACASVLQNLRITDMNLLEERTLNIGLEEILNLLKLSFHSKNPLTDLVSPRTSSQNVIKIATDNLPHPKVGNKPSISCMKMTMNLLKLSFHSKDPLTDLVSPSTSSQNVGKIATDNLPHPKVGNEPSISCVKMTVKLIFQKSKKKTVYAEVEEDFVDFLFSFLIIPFGRVGYLLDSSSSLGNLVNLYKSISHLNVGRYLKSQDIRDMLLYPKLATNSRCKNQMFPIDEVISAQKYYLTKALSGTQYYLHKTKPDPFSYSPTFLGPKSPNLNGTGTGGFVKGPAMYSVTDDLVVTPLSSTSGLHTLKRLKVPLNDIEGHVVSIGMEEALNILRASLNSTSALTDGLNLLQKIPKQEP